MMPLGVLEGCLVVWHDGPLFVGALSSSSDPLMLKKYSSCREPIHAGVSYGAAPHGFLPSIMLVGDSFTSSAKWVMWPAGNDRHSVLLNNPCLQTILYGVDIGAIASVLEKADKGWNEDIIAEWARLPVKPDEKVRQFPPPQPHDAVYKHGAVRKAVPIPR